MPKERTYLHKFWGMPEYPDRMSKVYQVEGGKDFYRSYFEVELYENNKRIKLIKIKNNSEQYAEDIAEDWVLGVDN